MMTGAVNDVRGQLEAFRDLGALAPETDLDDLMKVLKVHEPVKDPTKMGGHELVSEIQDVVKGLLRHGARLPKPLMLYVKGILFFDGATSRLAPDVNIFEQMGRIYAYFAEHHAERIARDIGFDPSRNPLDLEGFKRSLGLEGDVASLTQRELEARRAAIQKRIEAAGPRGG